MVFMILVCFYSYLTIRLLLTRKKGEIHVIPKVDSRLYIFDFFITAFFISYLFYYYIFNIEQSEFANLIIPLDFIWTAFTASLFLLGIGLGVKFMLSLLTSLIKDPNEIIFDRNKEMYQIFSDLWINVCFLVITFTYTIIEISKPTDRVSDTFNIIIVYSLSFILGALYVEIYEQYHIFVKKVFFATILITSLCLGLFIYESEIDYLKALPITTSFLVFNTSFFISLIFKITTKNWKNNNDEKLINKSMRIYSYESNNLYDTIYENGNYSGQIKNKVHNKNIQDEKNIQTHNRSNLLYAPHNNIYPGQKYNKIKINKLQIDQTQHGTPMYFSLKDIKLNN